MRSMILASLAATLVLLATVAAGAAPFSIDTSDGNGADSYVRLGQPTTNFGGSGGVTIKDSGGSSTTRKGYLRFDIPTNGVFSDVQLTLETSNNTSGGGSPPPNSYTVKAYGLDDGDAGENWGEGTITWNNAPANAAANDVAAGAVFLGDFNVPAVTAPDIVTFGSPALGAFINQDTDGNATILLVRDGGGGSNNLSFSSKEGSYTAPTLDGSTDEFGSVLSVTTSDGNGADSYVRQGESTNNFGAATGVVIKGGNGSTTRKGYLRFDISGVNQDQVLGAWLDLETSTNNSGGGDPSPTEFSVNVWGLNDGEPGENWIETGFGSINWDNAPANLSGNGIDTSMADLLGSIEVLDTETPDRVLFATEAFQDFLAEDTDGLVTLILQRSAGGSSNLAFASKENTTAAVIPTLNFAVAGVIPEPTAVLIWSLLATVGITLGGRRRKR